MHSLRGSRDRGGGWGETMWRGGYLMMILDYKGGKGVKNLGKSDNIVSECS